MEKIKEDKIDDEIIQKMHATILYFAQTILNDNIPRNELKKIAKEFINKFEK